MNNEELEKSIMELIFISGNAKSIGLQAIMCAEEGKFKEAEQKYNSAKAELHKAHEIQTKFLNTEINGECIEKSILLIHAQDHFMSANTILELVERFIKLYKKIDK